MDWARLGRGGRRGGGAGTNRLTSPPTRSRPILSKLLAKHSYPIAHRRVTQSGAMFGAYLSGGARRDLFIIPAKLFRVIEKLRMEQEGGWPCPRVSSYSFGWFESAAERYSVAEERVASHAARAASPRGEGVGRRAANHEPRARLARRRTPRAARRHAAPAPGLPGLTAVCPVAIQTCK